METHWKKNFEVHLLNVIYMKWLCEERVDDCLKHYEGKTNVENEWANIRKTYYEKSRRELIEYKGFTHNG
jgi:hypothetical protein